MGLPVQCCKKCRYFKTRQGTGKVGDCRRMPPVVDPVSTRVAWPTVKPSHWCGEFTVLTMAEQNEREDLNG
jgi:hypothetical protein